MSDKKGVRVLVDVNFKIMSQLTTQASNSRIQVLEQLQLRLN